MKISNSQYPVLAHSKSIYSLGVKTSTVRTRINDPCSRTFELPLLVRSGVFFFFLSRGADFLYFLPLSGSRNFGLPSTRIIYSSFAICLRLNTRIRGMLWEWASTKPESYNNKKSAVPTHSTPPSTTTAKTAFHAASSLLLRYLPSAFLSYITQALIFPAASPTGLSYTSPKKKSPQCAPT